MRKPISKHALRRALERVRVEGVIQWDEPTGAVVDKLWHQIGKRSFGGKKKKPPARARETIRTMPAAEPAESPPEPDVAAGG
ncbi:MAG: hypothetical protein ACREKN_09660 [Longimicrobiaceae bacterium]